MCVFLSCDILLPCDCEAYARSCYRQLSVRPSDVSNACNVTKRKHLAKKSSIMTNRKSPTSFPMGLRWTAYVAPKGGLKSDFFPFSVLKWAFLEESLLHSFFVWKLSAAKLYGTHWHIYQCTNGCWGRPLLPEILGQSDPPPSKTATSNRYSLVATVLWQNEMSVCKYVNTVQ